MLDLTGAQIEKIPQEQFNDSGTRAPTLILGVSRGFSYCCSGTRPVGDRVDPVSIKLNGEVLDPASTYRVTANTFLADGGDRFTTFAEGTNPVGGGADIAALTDYLTADSPSPHRELIACPNFRHRPAEKGGTSRVRCLIR